MRTQCGLLVAFAIGAGCAGGGREVAPVQNTQDALGQVTITSMDEKLATGTYLDKGETLTFEAKQVAAQVYSISVKLHGLTLDGTMDFANAVQSLDGYSTSDGVDTQMVEDDRLMILGFVKAIEKAVPGLMTQKGAPQVLGEIANIWAEWIPAMPLKYTKVFAQDRQTSICGQIGSYQWKNHDCWSCSNSSGSCNTGAYIGYGGSCSGDMWLWNGSSWSTCDDQNHSAWKYGSGNCFARCGEGCGSGTTYSEECARHDDCVRNGHWTTSSWCSDELSAACWGDCAPCGRN